MSILSYFRRQTTKDAVESAPTPKPTTQPDAKDVFQRPDLLAAWVAEHFIDGVLIEQDYDLLPDAEARKSLGITAEQRDRCLAEHSVLRASGVSLFVRQNYEDGFWLIFNDQLVQSLYRRLDRFPGAVERAATRTAVEEYVQAGIDEKPDAIASMYMRRIYDDNENYIRMKVSGIGDIANDTILSTYDILRDAYCQVMYGMSYQALKALNCAVAHQNSEA